MRNTKHAGELAELLFEYRATEIGMTVCRPHGDNARYDFAVDNGARFWKVQVKYCGAPPRGRHYNVNVCRHSQQGAQAYLPSEIDLLAAWVVPENRWYIFPVAVLGGRLNLKVEINEKEGGRFWNYVEAWDLLRAPEPAPVSNPKAGGAPFRPSFGLSGAVFRESFFSGPFFKNLSLFLSQAFAMIRHQCSRPPIP